MKKIVLVIAAILSIFLLTGCTIASAKYPRVEIVPTTWRVEHTYLPLREKHRFAEVPYSIEETDVGYNIIIHCVKEK